MDVNIKFNINKIYKDKKQIFDKKQILFEEQIMKDSNFFVPVKDHYLETSVIKDWSSHKGKGRLKWDVPYAQRLYNGDDFNFSKDKNPHSRAKWFEEAKKINLDNWLKILEK